MKKVALTKEVKLERINNSLNNSWKEFSYKDEAQIYNTYKMLLFWWLDQNPIMIDEVYELSRVDRLDFFSSTSYAFIKIANGQIKEWNFINRAERLPKNYFRVRGVLISANDIGCAIVTNHLIDYMTHCCGENIGIGTIFTKYEGELENDWVLNAGIFV